RHGTRPPALTRAARSVAAPIVTRSVFMAQLSFRSKPVDAVQDQRAITGGGMNNASAPGVGARWVSAPNREMGLHLTYRDRAPRRLKRAQPRRSGGTPAGRTLVRKPSCTALKAPRVCRSPPATAPRAGLSGAPVSGACSSAPLQS